MLYATRNFAVDRTTGTVELLKQDGMGTLEAYAKTLWYAWINPGMFRKIGRAWFTFFLPGFHPWKDDDRHLIAEYEASAPQPAAPSRQVRGAKAA